MAHRNSISQTRRQIVFARDAWICVYCGLEGELSVSRLQKPIRRRVIPLDENGRMFEIDHVLAVANGGTNHINNLVTACWSCNNKKSSKEMKPIYRMFRVDL